MIFLPPLTAMLLILSISREKMKFTEMISNFIRMLQIVMIFFVIFEATIYSVSVEDNETSVCFVKHQNIESSAIFMRDSVIDFLSCKFTFQSESEYATK